MTMPWSASCDTHPVAVTEVQLSGDDGATMPLTCRYPRNGTARGVAVFCHGLGSSGAAYGGLTDNWVRQGYIVIHPTFADSIFAIARSHPELGLDPADPGLVLWARQLPQVRPTMFSVLHDPAYWIDRVRIVRRVLEGMPTILSRLGVDTPGAAAKELPMAIAGHSFGAYTAQLFAGALVDLPEGRRSFRDHRFCAALVLSGQGRDQQGLTEGSWDHMTGPVLTVTGKKDGGAKGQDWHWKCEPYELAPPGDKYLAVLDDATHYLGGMTPEGDTVPYQAEALAIVTTAFLDAYLGRRPSARNWRGLVEDRIGNCPVIFRRK